MSFEDGPRLEASAPVKERKQITARKLGVGENPNSEAWAKVFSAVNRDHCRAAIRMAQEMMAASYSYDFESALPEAGDETFLSTLGGVTK